MDIRPRRSVRAKRQADGSHRRHGESDPAYPAGQPAAGGYLHSRLFHIPVYRHQRGDYRRAYSGGGGAGGENRHRPALYGSHRGGRLVLRRQPLVHIRHHDCIHKDAGLRYAGQVQSKFHDCSTGRIDCAGHLHLSRAVIVRRPANTRD